MIHSILQAEARLQGADTKHRRCHRGSLSESGPGYSCSIQALRLVAMSMLQSILLPFPITYTLPLINNCTPIHTPCNSLLLRRSLPGEARHAMGSPMGYDMPRCHITCITMTAYLHGAAVWLEGMERCSR